MQCLIPRAVRRTCFKETCAFFNMLQRTDFHAAVERFVYQVVTRPTSRQLAFSKNSLLLWLFFICGMLFECAGFWRDFEHRRFGKELGCVLDACLPVHTVFVLRRFSGFLFQTSCSHLSNSCCESRIFSLLGPRLKVEVTTWRERSILSAACRMNPMIHMRWKRHTCLEA